MKASVAVKLRSLHPFRLNALFLGLLLLSFAMPLIAQTTVDSGMLFQPWEDKDVADLGDDNSGSSFALSGDLETPGGAAALQVTPSGSSDETKLAFPVTGEALADWANADQVAVEVYLPEENELNPDTFFLGLGDVTGEFAWKGGVFNDAVDVLPGWNTVSFTPDAGMRDIDPEAQYNLFLSAYYSDESGSKVILTEPFYLGSIMFVGLSEGGSPSTDDDSVYEAEVDILLSYDDVGLIDAVARETFDFIWYEANPENGLVKDRSTPNSPSSVASVGFALAAIPIGVDRGWITYDQGYERVLTTLNTFANGGVEGENGFFYHFVDMETGERVWDSEVSSIDTTLFIAGALTAAEYFKGTEVETVANELYENIDWQWMMNVSDMVLMGWKPSEGFLNASWSHFDEGLLLYVLAIGSPTHPVDAELWAEIERPVNIADEYIYLSGEPLFVYQYPLAFMDLRGKEDDFANYFNNTVRACERNRDFAADNAEQFASYQNGVWGISASDGPDGYRAYGASGSNHDGTVAPYASIACLPFTPDIALESMRAMLTQQRSKVWREYGFVSAFNVDRDWYSTEFIGIDQGDTLLMIANYQDGFVWNLFMQNPYVQDAIDRIGFVESSGDYAVTPKYLEDFRSGN
jgi:hypothetical protein